MTRRKALLIAILWIAATEAYAQSTQVRITSPTDVSWCRGALASKARSPMRTLAYRSLFILLRLVAITGCSPQLL